MLNIGEMTESRSSWSSNKVGLIQMWVRDCQIHNGTQGYGKEKEKKHIYSEKQDWKINPQGD